MYHSPIGRKSREPERSRLTGRHWMIVAAALAGALLGSFAIVLLLGRLIS